MKRNIRYLLSRLLLPAWAVWAVWALGSCQSHDNPIIEPADDGEEVEVEVLISTRATGPSDGYVGDLIVMAFWCADNLTPDDRDDYRFAYYSNVTAGEITNDATGERKARFLIKQKEGKRQRFVFLANIYACGIYPHIFNDADITAETIKMQDALNYYTYFPYRRLSATPNDTIPGWSTSAGGQNEPFPMCGETINSYTFDDIESGRLFVLKNGTENEKVYLYRMAAKIDIQFTKQVIKDMGGEVKRMTLYNTRGKGYVGYNFSANHINSDFNDITSIGSDKLITLEASVPPDQTDCYYEQVYGIVPMPNVLPDAANDDEYIMQVDGPVYVNEVKQNTAGVDPDDEWRLGFIASDADETEYFFRLKGFNILRNCLYTIHISKVTTGGLSATLIVQPWTEKEVNADPIPLR